MDKRRGPAPHTQPKKSKSNLSKTSVRTNEETPAQVNGERSPTPPNGSPNGSKASLAHERRSSQTSQDRPLSPEKTEEQRSGSPQGSETGSQRNSRSPTPSNQQAENHEGGDRSRSPSETSQAPSQYEAVAPEDFDTKSFISSISDLSHRLQSDSLQSFDTDFDAEEMKSVVSAVTVSMENFRNYTTYSQQHLERLRGQIKETKDRMHRKIQLKPYDPDSAGERMSLEERELEEKVAQLNKELGRAAEELARAQQISSDTEFAATETALTAEKARKDAKRIQEEYEARRAADEEARKEEERKRQKEEHMRIERERQAEEHRQREEARRSKLKRDDTMNKEPDWIKWPTFTYRIESTESFDHGLGCIVRGNPNYFRENDIKVEKVPLLSELGELTLEHKENEELVSHVIEISGKIVENEPIYILIPHCTTRASAMSREPVMKKFTWNGWEEIQSEEVHLDNHKDAKFIQAQITKKGRYAVVTRYKRDYLQFPKRGGKVASNVDPRIVLSAERDAFKTKENFVLQIHPIDSGTLHEVRKNTPEGKGLLVSSAIMGMEWTSKEFKYPIVFHIPVPPNPVKARKAAAARAAREAQRKTRAPPPMPIDKEEERRRREEKKRESRRQAMEKANAGINEEEEEAQKKKPTRWYMGQYGANEDDEEDLLYLLYCDQRGKWQVAESVAVTHVKLDLVEFCLGMPHLYDKFVILRTKTDVTAKDALALTLSLTSTLSDRVCNFIIKQKSDDPYDVKMHVALHNRAEKILQQLEEEGYDDGPGISSEFVLREGDHIGATFRGNITAVEEDVPNLDLVFISQQTNCARFELTECNKFLQKSYNVYRGFVQLQKKAPLICLRRPKKNKKKSVTGGPPQVPVMPAMQYELTLLAEQLVSIPKDQDAPVSVIHKAPVIIHSNDVITEDTLRRLGGELGDEWQVLGPYLNVKRTRIQAIMRNNAMGEGGEDDAKFDMLMTWAKTVPKSMNKVEILRRALYQVGRDDLGEELQDMNEAYKRQRKGGE